MPTYEFSPSGAENRTAEAQHDVIPQWERVFRRQHEAVCVAATLDEYLLRLGANEISWEEFETHATTLPLETQVKYLEFAETYLKRRDQTRDRVQKLLAEWGLETLNEKFARQFFYRVTGHAPQGTLDAWEANGCLFFEIHNTEDYYTFYNGGAGEIDRVESGGFFSKTRSLNAGMPDIPVIVANGKTEKRSALVVHELQHFQNHCLADFDKTEWGESREALLEDYGDGKIQKAEYIAIYKMHRGAAGLKDELLAMLRAGSTVETLRTYLCPTDPRYGKHFTTATIETINNEILDGIESIRHFFTNPRAHAILVYHLFELPLQRIPARLKLLKKYIETTCTELRWENGGEGVEGVPIDTIILSSGIIAPGQPNLEPLRERYRSLAAVGGAHISREARECQHEYERIANPRFFRREAERVTTLPDEVRLPDFSAPNGSEKYFRNHAMTFETVCNGENIRIEFTCQQYFDPRDLSISLVGYSENAPNKARFRFSGRYREDVEGNKFCAAQGSQKHWHVFTHNTYEPEHGHLNEEQKKTYHLHGVRLFEDVVRRLGLEHEDFRARWIQIIPHSARELYTLIDREWVELWLHCHPGNRAKETERRWVDDTQNEGYVPYGPHQERMMRTLERGAYAPDEYISGEPYLIKSLDPSLSYAKPFQPPYARTDSAHE